MLKQYGGKASSGGFVAQIHANSRGLITKFAERNLTSELVNAMKQKYGWSGGFRSGIWGQKLSSFAFVGIGVAAGAQWNTFDGKIGLQDQIPYLVELFEKRPIVKEPKADIETEELATLPVRTEFELDMPLNLTEHESLEPSFVLLDELSFDDGEDARIADHHEIAEDHFAGAEIVPMQSDVVENSQMIKEEYQSLLEQFLMNLDNVEEQRVELNSLRSSLTQLNDLLLELVASSDMKLNVESTDPSFIEIDILPDEDCGDLRGNLMRNMSMIGQQQLQLSSLKEQLLIQNQQLQDLCEAAAAERPTVIRSSFSKRDACCGPGARE